MGGLSLEEITLYEIIGESACLDNILIIPALYELISIHSECESLLDLSLSKYMTHNGYEFSKVCLKFYKFSQPYSYFESVNQCNAIWVRAKIPTVFNFSPPTASLWRYELLNIPFIAVIFSNSSDFPQLHPFACIEENLMAKLQFYKLTTPEECLSITNAFWKLLLTCQGLSTFVDVVLGDRYDDYSSVVMGRDFICGYWNSEFNLMYP
jgi:hypothetical protein